MYYFINPEYFFSSVNLPASLWLPTGVFSFLEKPFSISDVLIYVLPILWKITTILCIFNIFYRYSSLVFFILTYFMFNLAHNYGYQTHTYMPLVLASFALTFGGRSKVFLVQFIFCSIFFSAGLSKVRNGGISWIASDSVQYILLRSQIFYSDAHQWASSQNFSLMLAQKLRLAQLLAAGVLVLELISPAALFQSRYRAPIIFSLLMMQISFYFLILVNFKFYTCLYIFWIPWSKILKKFLADTH